MITPTSSRRRRVARGFTLVELMISLVMGLIVAMAAVGLAKSATTSFHEQARSSVTEMAVRMASERLRQDLSRIGYMSTGNIQSDPGIARRAGVPDAAASRYADLATLRSVSIHPGALATQPAVAVANNLAPDSIDIVGNLTTDDQYSGTIYTGGCGQIVRLDPMADAAVFALAGGDVGNSAGRFDAAAKAAFRPDPTQEFLAQVTDAMGCKHYVPVCSVDLAPGSTGTSSYLLVGIDGSKPQSDPGSGTLRGVLYSNSNDSVGLNGNCGSSEMGQVTIAPLSRVRWSLAMNSMAELDPATGEPPANKYNLVRQRYDWTGVAVSGAPEIIAEFAVDLKFGFTYAMPGAPHNIGVADLDGPAALFSSITESPTFVAGARGPQHLRSIRYRVAVRTSVPDRDTNLIVAPAPYISRYCADGNSPCQKYSRVRTIVSEVALMNQAGMSW